MGIALRLLTIFNSGLNRLLTGIKQKWNDSVFYRIYCLLMAASLIKQILFPSFLVDSREFISAASDLLANGGWNACSSKENCQLLLSETRRTPGYPFIVAVTRFYFVVYIIQTLFALYIPVLMSRLMVIWDFDKRQERLTDLVLLLCPLQFFYSAMLMPDILVQLLLLFMVLSWSRNQMKAVSFCLTGLVLLKPLFLPLVWIALPLILIRKEGRFNLFIPVLIVLFVSGVNKMRTGSFHYTSMGAVNAWEYNIRGLSELQNSNYIDSGLNRMKGMDYAQKLEYLNNSVKTAVLNNLSEYALIHAKGVLASIIDPGRYDFIAFFQLKHNPGFLGAGMDKWRRIINNQSGLTLSYFALFFLINLVRIGYCVRAIFILRAKVLLPLMLPVFYVVLLTGPVGSARYLLPVIPFIAILAAAGMRNTLVDKLVK